MEYKTPRKMFSIYYREAGSNSYYVAMYRRPELGRHEVYTRKSLSSLKSFLRKKNADFVIHAR